ncbi:hypothetical protein [Campylobacter sp. MIT 97-5078]|uniref:hypothetical protein n=1 Tax=Campylobacter sp. MIT 97-5078 TaxID=1548153 RepID=UPI0005141975|nr:hypothetical protein [Campylobacter sp. MIT 97-5078]KGI55446.1 hypothetical protein LR59_12025 [Campylobacter sp. MIT 97-5078]KGI57355.1 hypothetical protein LR59_01095 [Campylobacter sp. MIT 97-5078]TQR27443.1 hypothetical protein DMB91_04085 [Campylobacter sp. MIT 97-5078]
MSQTNTDEIIYCVPSAEKRKDVYESIRRKLNEKCRGVARGFFKSIEESAFKYYNDLILDDICDFLNLSFGVYDSEEFELDEEQLVLTAGWGTVKHKNRICVEFFIYKNEANPNLERLIYLPIKTKVNEAIDKIIQAVQAYKSESKEPTLF